LEQALGLLSGHMLADVPFIVQLTGARAYAGIWRSRRSSARLKSSDSLDSFLCPSCRVEWDGLYLLDCVSVMMFHQAHRSQKESSMNLRSLGTTGLTVTRMGLGLAALGRPGYLTLGHAADLAGDYAVAAMEAHAHRVLDAAWDAGIRYFDAARSYGRAEQFLATWLRARQIPSADVVVGSKWGYIYTADWRVDAPTPEVKDHSLANLQRQWQESQALLVLYLRLYQIHSATFESGILDDQAVLAELARLKASGMAIGLTLSGPNQAAVLERAATITVEGKQLFDAVQATWNLLEPSAGPALVAAHAAGMGVIVKEALANGQLTDRNSDPAFAPQRLMLERQALRLQTSVDALALAAALAQPWVDVVLSGAATVEQLRANIWAPHVAWDAEAEEALAKLAEPPAAYWERRRRLLWN
jgi:aryl-alcohol dehydrogenase-like predicted oxidoreductase